MIISSGWSPKGMHIFRVFNLYSQSHFRNILTILILISIIWEYPLALPLQTGYYLRQFVYYKQHISLFTTDSLAMWYQEKNPFHAKIKKIFVLRKGEEKVFFIFAYCHFFLYKCLFLSLKGTTPTLFPPHSSKLLRYFKSHGLLVTFSNPRPYWSFPSLYSNSNPTPIGDMQDDQLEKWFKKIYIYMCVFTRTHIYSHICELYFVLSFKSLFFSVLYNINNACTVVSVYRL